MVFGDISIKLLSQPLLTCFPLFVMERPLPTVVHSLARRSAAAEAAGAEAEATAAKTMKEEKRIVETK